MRKFYSKDTQPSVSEYGKLRSYLAKMGVKNDVIDILAGVNGTRKRRTDVSKSIADWVRTLPKKDQ